MHASNHETNFISLDGIEQDNTRPWPTVHDAHANSTRREQCQSKYDLDYHEFHVDGHATPLSILVDTGVEQLCSS
ncbi:hypothetical protein PsorP6_002751 [Peronosclerospora sorghi]|uniref:Uncharacterized protein n=1 Tax=Peronosclerospora sorghi TaxID=230839 RepID=A0ACC0WQM5_9STRA|nr:hypothetical protein PsorP6_002751 [Peronosclerospora sorghi]